MAENGTEKTPIVTSKSFMSVGPTLHYSHENVQRYWLLALAAFVLTCLFFSKLITGSFWSFSLNTVTTPELWHFGRYVTTGVSIFEYPWQILVLGLLMGTLAIVPVLISQLMSFTYSLPFILSVFLLANLPAFAGSLVISCIGAACRPLRFRSRFIAIALCTAPQLIYWGYFGPIKAADPVIWGFSFTPWICAWLTGLAIAGLVIGIGHFTRYRPGFVWIATSAMLLISAGVFEVTIGFDELDYQLYVAKNNPEQISEFHDHSITEALDETITNPAVRKYLAGFFYPTDAIPLREELKREIQIQLKQGRWPSWFIVTEELKHQAKRQMLFDQYEMFIVRRPKSHRMPIALYFKALLSEYSPDIKILGQKEILHFYSDYPHERSRGIWFQLYSQFGNSPESLEARWRVAMHWAGQAKFTLADTLLAEAQTRLSEQMKLLEKQEPQTDTIFSPFHAPAESLVTVFKLRELQRKINLLRNLISLENRTNETEPDERLAKFIMLNPHASDYADELERLLKQLEDTDPLRDNVLLAKTKLIADEQLRAEKLSELHEKFIDTDGGMQALYELALSKISFWRQQSEANPEQKKKYLTETRETLMSFLNLYPESFYCEQVKKNLEDLPTVE